MADVLVPAINPATGKLYPDVVPSPESAGVTVQPFSWLVPGPLTVGVVPGVLQMPNQAVRAALSFRELHVHVDVVGVGGTTTLALTVDGVEAAALTLGASTVVAVGSAWTIDHANYLQRVRLVVKSVPATPPQDVTVTLWWG